MVISSPWKGAWYNISLIVHTGYSSFLPLLESHVTEHQTTVMSEELQMRMSSEVWRIKVSHEAANIHISAQCPVTSSDINSVTFFLMEVI